MKILFASSEAHPLVKTGGLADVSGALPPALKALGQDLRLVLPAYGSIHKALGEIPKVAEFQVPGLPGMVGILQTELAESGIPVWLVDYDPAFARLGNPYTDANSDPWKDNAERFALFCKAIAAIALNQAGLDWKPDALHCNDWQTGLAPALIQDKPQRPVTVFTIHNLAYQGLFPASYMSMLGLPAHLYSPTGLEFYGQLSFIKGGLAYADHITTVSPNYMEEIKTKQFGCGLQGLLQHRAADCYGILNGVDTQVWNPDSDPHIAKNYQVDNFSRNKPANKSALQQTFALDVEEKYLLLGFIGRLVEQKGVDLILEMLRHGLPPRTQLVILGSGDPELERQLKLISHQHSENVSVFIGYDEHKAHLIEAGADAFLMPSRFEPCGLNQMYSMCYGTLPIVTPVGGLKDTVIDSNKQTLKDHSATGFVLDPKNINAAGLSRAIQRALEMYQQPRNWNAVIRNGMRRDFSWRHSAQQYLALYKAERKN